MRSMKINNYQKIPVTAIKDHVSNVILTMLLLMLILFTALPLASASGQDATFDSVEVSAMPAVQGMGGEIRINAVANFFGGCCYHLYAHDIKAELNVLNDPENVKLIGPAPPTLGTLDAKPGGKATTADFQWTITSDVPGTYTLEVTVSSSNCGSKSSEILITINEGASVSLPTIFPKKPSVDEAITFSADVRAGSESVEIKRTSLFIWRTTSDHSINRIQAEDNRIFEIIGGDLDNLTSVTDGNTSYRSLGEGSEYQMSHMQFTSIWRVTVDDFDEEENIYYWFKVETSDGKNITSAVYKQDILDLEKKYQMLEQMKWGTFFVIAIGVALILGIYWRYYDRLAEKIDEKGIFILGSTIYSHPSEGKRTNVSGLSIEKFRSLLFILFLIITIIFIIISLYLGLFEALITETGGLVTGG